jgi:hypothetical protein
MTNLPNGNSGYEYEWKGKESKKQHFDKIYYNPTTGKHYGDTGQTLIGLKTVMNSRGGSRRRRTLRRRKLRRKSSRKTRSRR